MTCAGVFKRFSDDQFVGSKIRIAQTEIDDIVIVLREFIHLTHRGLLILPVAFGYKSVFHFLPPLLDVFEIMFYNKNIDL